jgi:plastocyanin
MKIERREFVTSVLAGGLAVPAVASHDDHDDHDHRMLDGPLASTTVSFGAWPTNTDPVLDRFLIPNAPQATNAHVVLPYVATVKVGGSVRFVVAGFHIIAVYGPGTKPEDINAGNTIPIPGAPPGFPLVIDDPENRVYRGINPIAAPQDRVEVVQFNRRGTYLVICAFLPHFVQEMWGYVKVVR